MLWQIKHTRVHSLKVMSMQTQHKSMQKHLCLCKLLQESALSPGVVQHALFAEKPSKLFASQQVWCAACTWQHDIVVADDELF
jgi:hypothetical protein